MTCLLLLQEGDLYEAVCSGCETSETSCQNCSFNERHLVPSCKDVIDHATSLGGLVTLAMLTIDPGYWRATTSSPHALACYNADACLGGVTATSGYCLEGYEGPCEYDIRPQVVLHTAVYFVFALCKSRGAPHDDTLLLQ